ncbi:MAG: hypothetical protein B6I19_05700 [Bacteroidetes bacterium 4572_114]|nr:MAG: hypothetical protein B6I19_05700 [Bacteroidetes bacterium 4572_114]
MFKFEKDMLPVIENAFYQKFDNAKFIREFNSGNGISDLTVATPNDEKPSIVINNYNEMYYLINFFNRKGKVIHPKKLVSKKNLNSKTFSNLITKLLDGGYVSEQEGYYIVERLYKSPVKNIISIEAKLSKWRDGYYQALRYKCFSHKSFLAVSSKYIKNVDIDLFRKVNVGLISVLEDYVKIIVNPKREIPKDTIAFYHLSESVML